MTLAIKSRLLSRLDVALAGAREPLQAACIAAERAALLARMGRCDDAAAELARLRAAGGTAHGPALGVWLCVADGMVEQERGHALAARDRLQRAHALAGAARLRPLIALTAAWLAHADHAQHDDEACVRHVTEALQDAAHDHHAALARAALVVAQAFHEAGRPDRAQPWYRRAHEHATAEGDDTTLGALLRHRAAVGGRQARLAAIFKPSLSPADAMALRHAQMSLESSEHFDAHCGHAASRAEAQLLHAQLLAAQGCHERARRLLQQRLDAGVETAGTTAAGRGAPDAARAQLHADIAWCAVNLGQPHDALLHARAAEPGLGAEGDAAARAAAHGRLRQVYAELHLDADAALQAARADALLAAWRETQARCLQRLDAALQQVTDAPRAGTTARV